jgi:flagellar hook-associated protein 1 FlgK
MSGLFSTLNATVQALSAQSVGLNITGKNLSNVNNPAYSRERVILGNGPSIQTPQGSQSTGLEALGIEQIRDTLLDQQVSREVALSSSYDTQQQILQNAQAGLGQNINNTSAASGTGSNAGTGGLSAAIDDFFNAFQGLAASPTDAGQQQTLVQKAAILSDTFQQTDAGLAQVQSDATARIQADVSSVNQLLQTVADLNKQIGSVEIGKPNSAVDLRDQRQATLEQLAAKVPVTTLPGANGMIQVVMKDATNANVVLVNGATVTGPVVFTGTGLAAGVAATPVQFSSGSIYGALTARDGAVQDLRDSLDNLAKQIVTSVNTAYSPSGANFFNPAGTTAGTIALAGGLTATTLAAGTGAAGDNSIALAVAAVAGQSFSTASATPDAIDGTINQYFSGAVSNFGQALATINTHVDNQSNVASLVKAQRDGVSGVSLDEEMANLVRYQSAYQASARVFTIVNDLLGTVINSMGN